MFDAVKFAGYKSFLPDKEIEIPKLEYVSLFIGKNNCGKSSVLDLIGAAFEYDYRKALPSNSMKLCLGYKITGERIAQTKQYISYSYNRMKPINEHEGEIIWTQQESYANHKIAYNDSINPALADNSTFWNHYVRGLPYESSTFKRIAAER